MSPRIGAWLLLGIACAGCDESAGLATLEPRLEITGAVDFGAVPLGSTKRVAVAVENSGTADLHLGEVRLEAPFTFELTGTVLGPGQRVTLDLAFTPVAVGAQLGRLTLSSDAKDRAEASITLSGEGVVGRLSVQPTRIELGTVVVGTERRADVSLLNGGDAEVRGTLIAEGFDRPEHWSIGGLTNLDEGVPFVVAARGLEARPVIYRPLAEAKEGARLRFEVCGERCGPEIPVSALAVRAQLWLEPFALDLGDVGLGGEASGLITVRGGTGPAVMVTRVGSSGPAFEVTTTRPLPTEVSEASSLGVTVRFRPAALGPTRAQLSVETTDPAAPRLSATLLGNGVGPSFTVAPNPLSFGVERRVGQYRRSLLLVSSGSGPVVVQGLNVPGGTVFGLGEHAPLPLRLEGGESATIDVLFTPTTFGEFHDELRVDTDAGPVNVPLSGGVAEHFCELELSPSPLDFGLVPVGSERRRPLLVSNAGADPCEVIAVSLRAPLDPAIQLVTPFAPFTLTAGQQATLEVAYHPNAPAEAKAILDVRTSDPAFPNRSVRIEGRSDGRGDCLAVQPDHLDYGRVQVGQVSRLAVSVSNVGLMTCRILATSLVHGGQGGFSTTTFSASIPPGQVHAISVALAPVTATVAVDVLAIETDDPAAPRFEIPLRGVSAEPAICVEPRQIDFGPVTAVTRATFEIRACRSSPVEVHGLDFTTPAPELRLVTPPALPFTLAAGQSQTVTVEYAPGPSRAVYGVVTVDSDDLAEPSIPVVITAGELVAPPEAGRFLYYWQIAPSQGVGGTIARQALQGGGTPTVVYGATPGQSCVGCHSISPDGRYLAMYEAGVGSLVLDTTTGAKITLPPNLGIFQFSSWNPDLNDGDGYELVYSDGFDLHLASLNSGDHGVLVGASEGDVSEIHPSWGPNGTIAFAKGPGGGAGLLSPVDIYEIPDTGGVAMPVLGASGAMTNEYYPSYSPDGRWLAFTEAQLGSTISAPDARVRLVRTDGSGSRHELPDANQQGISCSYPTWSVDGRFLSFSAKNPATSFDLYLVPFDSLAGVEGVATPVTGVNTVDFEHGALWSR